jgi:hypothetical protein
MIWFVVVDTRGFLLAINLHQIKKILSLLPLFRTDWRDVFLALRRYTELNFGKPNLISLKVAPNATGTIINKPIKFEHRGETTLLIKADLPDFNRG